MRRDTGARLRSAMADRDVDALILLGNNAVVCHRHELAARRCRAVPRRAPGRSGTRRRRVAAPVSALSGGRRRGVGLPADHVHGPVYLEFDEGVETFARPIAALIPRGTTIAVDEFTGAMRRATSGCSPTASPSMRPGRQRGKAVKTPDEIACIRTAARITDEAMVDVQAALAPGIRQIDLSATFLRRAFELGAVASMLEPIWQVMPESKAEGVWTTHGDLALPLLTTERELAAGDVLWTDVSITYGGYCSDFGRTWIVGRDPTPRQQAQFTNGATS